MKDLLEILNRWQVQYLIVGAHALSIYTEPRSTKDLDVWVNPTPENVKLVYGALNEFGAPLFETTEQYFTEKDSFLIIGEVPNRIDILKNIPGVEFETCWEGRKTLDIGGTTAHFPKLEDLLAAKIAAGRPQDLVDAAKLKKVLELERKQLPTERQKRKAPEQGVIRPQKPTERPRRSKKENRGKKKGT
jgi:hypothetical protein